MIGNKTAYRIEMVKDKGHHYIYSEASELPCFGGQANIKEKMVFYPESRYATLQHKHALQSKKSVEDTKNKVGFVACTNELTEKKNRVRGMPSMSILLGSLIRVAILR